MKSTSEVGHAKNLANLQRLIDLATQITVPPYTPNNPQLTVAGLTALQAQCTADFNNYTAKFTTYKAATNDREIAFKPLKQTATQILDNVASLNIPVQTVNDIKVVVHKIHGLSNKLNKNTANTGTAPGGTTGDSTPNPTSSPTPPPSNERTIGSPVSLPNPVIIPPVDGISTSQQSYDSLLANLDKLISQLQAIPLYTPNETAIKVSTLSALSTSLHAVNIAAINSINALALARNQRNLTFYSNTIGMVDITKKVKSYIRQIEGSTSAIYHQATAIKFVKFNLVNKKKKK